ncbi:hypothetical protein F5I97DRAFT_1829124 [Phlebopus sp. FC_14]|nr:hypothetical protein F5I97DRAFT_1829124 [Phlebopus sp. FC_14]
MPNKCTRSPTSKSDDKHEKHGHYAPKHSKKSKKLSKCTKKCAIESGDEDSNESEEDDDIRSDYEQHRVATHAVTHCMDMFCDIGKAISIALWTQRKVDEDEDMEEPVFFKKLPLGTIEHYKRELVNNPTKSTEYNKVIKKMNQAMKTTHSDDSAHLRDKIVFYAAFNPVGASIMLAIYPSSSKLQLGINHIILAVLLCPINSLWKFKQDPECFLWTNNGEEYDEDVLKGLFRGYYLEQVFQHIFVGPSIGMGKDTRDTCLCNANLHHLNEIMGPEIPYSAVQIRWSKIDGTFHYHQFYYTMMGMIADCPNPVWKGGLLKHYNVLTFKDENGRKTNPSVLGDLNKPESSSCSFLSKMHAQIAARASASATLKPIVKSTPTCPTIKSASSPICTGHHSGSSVESKMVTPPPTSPPCPALIPAHVTFVVDGPSTIMANHSHRGVLPSSKLTELDMDSLEDVTDVKIKSRSFKKTSTIGKGKQKAILSDEEDPQPQPKKRNVRKKECRYA